MQQKLISLCALLWAVSKIDISPALYPAIRRLHLSIYERKSINEITSAIDKLLDNIMDSHNPL